MDWHQYFFNLLIPIAAKSKDESTKIGCVVVGPDNEIRTTGYNSFPRGIDDSIASRQTRPEKYFFMEHAERNAIYNAARIGVSLKNCRLYVDRHPCDGCARGIVQSGIREVIIDADADSFKEQGFNDRWKESIGYARQILDEAKVTITLYKR
jgi:dCMP deaminase